MQAEHSGARARRGHDVVEVFELRDRLARKSARVGAVARVVSRLAAAGLRRRHDDVAACGREKLHGGEADRRPEQVDQAGDEQRDRRAAFRIGHRVSIAVPGGRDQPIAFVRKIKRL